VKLNLKVGIFISDNTDLWLTDTSCCNCDICHLPDFITFFFIVVYVALIKQAVVKRIRSECSTHSKALDDVKVLNTTNPPFS
jgi:hypothetical protein